MSHIGYIDRADTIGVISAIESVLKNLGHEFEFGAGTRTASETLRNM